jgi:hypothetical protein
MIANSLLVRWAFGWYEVKGNYTPQRWPGTPGWVPADAPYRREALLGLGAVQSEAEVVRVAAEQLGWFGDPRTEITADLAPVDDSDTPYLAFGVGDFVTVPDIDGLPAVERVIGLTVTEDEHGTVTFAPELKDRILTDMERWQRNLDKMAAGTVAGNSAVATPVSDTRDLGKDCCPPGPTPGAWYVGTEFMADLLGPGDVRDTTVWTVDANTMIRYYGVGIGYQTDQSLWVNGSPVLTATMEDCAGPTFPTAWHLDDQWNVLYGHVNIPLNLHLAPGDQVKFRQAGRVLPDSSNYTNQLWMINGNHPNVVLGWGGGA